MILNRYICLNHGVVLPFERNLGRMAAGNGRKGLPMPGIMVVEREETKNNPSRG